jgi:hypothetical protein
VKLRCFYQIEFSKKLNEACSDIVNQIRKDSFLEKSVEAVPPHLYVPNETKIPHFLQIDFAVAIEEWKSYSATD